MSESPRHQRYWWMPACILIAGLLLRSLYFVEVSRTPEFSNPIYDPEYNAYWGRALATGDWSVPAGMPDPEIRTTPHGRPPGYPWFLAAVYVVFGVNDYAPRVVQMVIGLINALLLYVIGTRLFGAAAGFLAGMFMAVYWVFPYFEGVLSYPSVAILLLLLMIYALMRWHADRRAGWLAVAGALLGAFALFRPNGLLLAPLLLVWAAAVLWKAQASWKRMTAALAVFVFGCAGVVAPAFVRNYVVARDVVLLSSYGGINLYVGNHPDASLVEPRIPELMDLAGIENWSCFDYPAIVRGIAAAEGRDSMKFSEANRYFYRKAFAFIAENPGVFLRNLARKALLFFGPHEITNDTVVEYDKRFSQVLAPLPGFPWVLALFGLGVFLFLLEVPRRLRAGQDRTLGFEALLLAVFCLYCVSVILYFVAGRYRVPVIPLMLLFAAYGVVSLLRAFGERRWGAGLGGVLVLACLVPLAHWNITGHVPSRGTWHLRRAMALTAQGEDQKAREEYLRALEYGAESSVIYANLGRLHFEDKEVQQGLDMYARGLEHNPNNAVIRNNLGYELYKLGRIDEAIPHLEAAVAVNPRFTLAHLNLGNALADRGDTDAALTHFREAMRLDPKRPAGPYNVARMLFARGDVDGAIEYYGKVLDMAPDHVMALNNLGYCYASRGEPEKALPLYERAVGADPAFVLARANLGNALMELGRFEEAKEAYSLALDHDPSNARLLYSLGRVCAALREWEKAIAHLERAFALSPEDPAITTSLDEARAAQAKSMEVKEGE